MLTNDETLLITTCNEDIEVTELATGKRLHKLEGVRKEKDGVVRESKL